MSVHRVTICQPQTDKEQGHKCEALSKNWTQNIELVVR